MKKSNFASFVPETGEKETNRKTKDKFIKSKLTKLLHLGLLFWIWELLMTICENIKITVIFLKSRDVLDCRGVDPTFFSARSRVFTNFINLLAAFLRQGNRLFQLLSTKSAKIKTKF